MLGKHVSWVVPAVIAAFVAAVPAIGSIYVNGERVSRLKEDVSKAASVEMYGHLLKDVQEIEDRVNGMAFETFRMELAQVRRDVEDTKAMEQRQHDLRVQAARMEERQKRMEEAIKRQEEQSKTQIQLLRALEARTRGRN